MGWWILVLVLVKKAVKYFKKCTQSDSNKNKQPKKSFIKVSEEHTKEVIEGKSEVDINENMNNNDGVESSEIPSHHCELPSPHSDIKSEHSGITSEHSDIPSEHTKTYSTNISTIEAKDAVLSSDSSEASEDLSSSESSENISCDFSFNRR